MTLSLSQKILIAWLRKFPFDQGKSKLAKGLNIPGEKVSFTTSQGIHLNLDTGEYQQRQIFIYGNYERNTLRHLFRLLPKGAVCIDAGANIGYHSLFLAKQIEDSQLFSFEPNPFIFDLLQKNLSLNKNVNIEAIPLGLSDKPGKTKIHFRNANLGTSSVFSTTGDREEEITLVKFDDWANERKLEKIDLIKADVEGSEKFLLAGAEHSIRSQKKMVLVIELMEENCKRAGYSAKELFEWILSLNFRAYIPKAFPMGMKEIFVLPENYQDNIIFLKGY